MLSEASKRDLRVLICTYLYGPEYAAVGATIEDFSFLLAAAPPSCKILLLHGGVMNLLTMMEIVRPHTNVLLDLSFVICRYEGSSIDLDIKFLFRSFDRRICVGSDSPQFELASLRRRFNDFAQNVEEEKCINIGYRNLHTFLGKD